ncbi:MAG: hypothetical protein WCS73_12765 [Lentisphaeria bacterium]
MMKKNLRKTVLIADAHVLDGTPAVLDFFAMLDCFSSSNYDVCFLGDVMELWFGLERFETPVQLRFLKWCKSEKPRRKITFVEGNHEFFVIRKHLDCFSDSATEVLRLPSGECLVHGDVVQCNKWKNAIFRMFLKGEWMYWILLLCPFAPAIAKKAKQALEFKNRKRVPRFPLDHVKKWCHREFQKGAHRIFMGHFHNEQKECDVDKNWWCCLPAWKDAQKVMLYDRISGTTDILYWKKLFEKTDS